MVGLFGSTVGHRRRLPAGSRAQGAVRRHRPRHRVGDVPAQAAHDRDRLRRRARRHDDRGLPPGSSRHPDPAGRRDARRRRAAGVVAARRLIFGHCSSRSESALDGVGLFRSSATASLFLGIGMLAILDRRLADRPGGRPADRARAVGVGLPPLFGTVGVLATQNSLRNPRRTAATASALMIGLTLMVMMSVFGASLTASLDKSISTTLTSQLVVSNVTGRVLADARREGPRGRRRRHRRRVPALRGQDRRRRRAVRRCR